MSGQWSVCAASVTLIVFGLCGPVHAQALRVTTDTSKAAGCEGFARRGEVLIEEWYPKIDAILFGDDHIATVHAITLVCEPMKPIAYTDIHKNRIHISASYVAKSPDSDAVMIHELTHIVQHYDKLARENVWLQEGIADYVRHEYFERDLAALHVDSSHDTYRTGYRVTAVFLAWVQRHEDPTLIRDLNKTCAAGTCTPELFVRFCGRPVDALWTEFTESLNGTSVTSVAH